ncbi:MAG: spondin domain-containing protein, partial [Anaerolineales bacterium]
SLLAEDGDPSALAALLGESDEVFDLKVADGPLMPGATMVFELEARGRFDRVSAVGMLVVTNDAFFGLKNFLIENGAEVFAILPQRISLEDLFIEIVGTDGGL